MAKFFLALITLGLLVSGCASAPPPPLSGGRFAWDGLGQNPNKPVRHKRRPAMVLASNKADKPDPNAERGKVLATLRAYSAAWWAVQDEIEAEEHFRGRKSDRRNPRRQPNIAPSHLLARQAPKGDGENAGQEEHRQDKADQMPAVGAALVPQIGDPCIEPQPGEDRDLPGLFTDSEPGRTHGLRAPLNYTDPHAADARADHLSVGEAFPPQEKLSSAGFPNR